MSIGLLGTIFIRGGGEDAGVRSRVMMSGFVVVVSISSGGSIFVVIGRSGSGSSGSREAINVIGSEVGVTRRGHHGVKVGVVEAGGSGSGVGGGLERVNLCIGEVGRARSGGREALGPSRKDVGSGGVGFSDGDVELSVLFDLGLGFQGLSSIKRHDVGVHVDGDNGGASVWKLLRDQHSGASVLEHEQHQGVPYDALEYHYLDHQTPRELPVHSLQQRNAHHQRVREGGDGEQRYGPLQTPPLADVAPDRQHHQDDHLLQRVRRDEPEVHLVGVVRRDEVEGE